MTPAQSLFDSFISGITLGVLPDLKAAIIAVAVLLSILFAFEVILALFTSMSLSDRIGKFREDLDYEDYAARQRKKDYFRDRYSVERANRLDKSVSWNAPSRNDYRRP